MNRTMTNEQTKMVQISKEDLYRLIAFVARIDQSIHEFDIINKADYNPEVHHTASLDMLENCFLNPEQFMSMLTDDAMVVFKLTPKKCSEISEELGKSIEYFSAKINDGNNNSDDIIEFVEILILLRDIINQNIEQ